MKKSVLFLTLVAIFMCNTAFAQMFTLNPNANGNQNFVSSNDKAGYFKLGLCANEFDDSSGLGLSNTSAEIHAMAKLSADFVTPYVGAEIAGINVGMCKTVNNVTVFVRETSTGNDIASKTVSSLTAGWNEVIFDTPLNLEKKNYYIGYHIPTLPAATYAIGYTEESATTQDALLLSIDNGELADYTGDFGALTVQMLLTGNDDMFGNIVEITEVGMPGNVEINSVIDVPVKVRNAGINDVSNIEITYSLGTNAPVQKTFNINMAAGSSAQTVTIEDVTVNMSGDFNVKVSKVNGVEFDGATNTTAVTAYDPALVAERNVLLEQFTTEKCGYCPPGAARIKSVIEQPEFKGKVHWVAHHAGFYTDAYTIPESESYLRLYGTGGTYAPAMMLDRTVLTGSAPVMDVGYEAEITKYFREALNIPTTITVDITQANTIATDRKVKITAHGVDKSGTPSTEDLYVVIFLLENGITTNSQSGTGGTTYTHNNLIRDVLGDNAAGTKIEWNGNAYSVTVEATLPEAWNAEKMDVVAFVAKNYMNPVNNAQVLNSKKTTLAMTNSTAIDNVFGKDMTVYAENGTIVVKGEYTSINVYSIDGKEFRNNNLPKGIYIVKVENNGQNIVKKVMVK